MLKTITSTGKTAWLVFFSLSVCYLPLAPGTTEGRGYVPDDRDAALGLLASFNAWVKGRPIPPLTWTRHGPLPLLFDLPFIKLGKLVLSPDFMLSLEPVLLTAALLTIVYIWLRKLCTPGMSLLLTLIGAFATMLWPYAYIGLETKQSFFVFLAGYLALAQEKIRTWPRLILFSTVCSFAICTKSTGLVVAPAIAYLVYVQFRSEWSLQWKRLLTLLLIVGGIWTLNAIGWNVFWTAKGGGTQILLQQWSTDSFLHVFANVIGVFGSPNKGLFLFAPVLLFGPYAIPHAFRAHRELTIFALLVTGCTVAFISILFVTADELWGPRFMHIAIAPLLVMIGAACPHFRWRRDLCLVVLGAFGAAISFLGAFYYYGYRSAAAADAGQNTLEWFAGDMAWNEVVFDARVFNLWLKGGSDPVPWTPRHTWAWTPPPDAPPWKTVNLRDYTDPQSFLLYYWRVPLQGSALVVFGICAASAILGPLLLLWVIARTISVTKEAKPAVLYEQHV